MKYDPSLPAAVFLGPSLELEAAQKILRANYYPPVRMGDIYRLLGSGTQVIIVIDGVFHEVTPIWQREILAAIRKGITVIGASSMGALRAAELAEYGMIGCGTIFQWYRDGIIDGDDEVALLHGDEMLGYPAISEPLVNIRYTLEYAVELGLIPDSFAQELVEQMKTRHFAERSYQSLLNQPSLDRLATDTRMKFSEMISKTAIDLKRSDALEALHYCADMLARRPVKREPQVRPTPDPQMRKIGIEAFEYLKRGLLRSDGSLISAETVIRKTLENDTLVAQYQQSCALRFFLQQYLKEEARKVPENFYACFSNRWKEIHVKGERDKWLRSVGLTPIELEDAIRQRAKVEWLLERAPESFGIDFAVHQRCADSLTAWHAGRTGQSGQGGFPESSIDKEVLLKRMAEACYVTTWARRQGIECPMSVSNNSINDWERQEGVTSRNALLKVLQMDEDKYVWLWSQRAFYHWLIERGPAYFGYVSFSFPEAVLLELQITGAIREMVERTKGPH